MTSNVSTQASHKGRRRIVWSIAGALTACFICAGCSHTAEAPTPVQQQQSVEAQVQSIQSSNMPAAAKQQAIAGIKAQQSHTATKP